MGAREWVHEGGAGSMGVGWEHGSGCMRVGLGAWEWVHEGGAGSIGVGA